MPRGDHLDLLVQMDSQDLWAYQADKDQGADQDHQDQKDHEETQEHQDQWDQLQVVAPKDQTQKPHE